jgi:hypothetical protein
VDPMPVAMAPPTLPGDVVAKESVLPPDSVTAGPPGMSVVPGATT